MEKILSFFTGFNRTMPSDITMPQIYTSITTDPALRSHTEMHRHYLRTNNKQAAADEKKSCPAFTPAVRCEGGRGRKHIVAYTGLSLCDFDHIAPERVAEVFATICADPHTLLAYKTISDLGIRVIFAFDGIPVAGAEPAARETLYAYQEAYRQGNEYYARLTGQEYDSLCKNPERISGLAYDPQACFNPGALPLTVKLPEKPQAKARRKPGRPPVPGKHRATAEATAESVYELLDTEGIAYEPGHHNEYIMRTGYLFNLYGVPEAEALAWAVEAFGDYGPANVEAIFRSCYQKTEEHGTRRLAESRKKGGKEKEAFCASVEEIETFLSGEALFRINIITRQCELKWPDEKAFRELTDRDGNTLWGRINKRVKRTNISDVYNVLNSEFSPHFNPFQEYFASLPEWDGKTDYIGQVAATVHARNDNGGRRFAEYFRKWFVGILPTLFEEDVVNHEILALVGPQGIYKTTWFNHLLPPELRRYFYTKTNSARLVKDDLFTLCEHALVCFEEIDNMGAAELNQLKAMTTLLHINERAAYGRNKERRHHIASFCATGNNIQFLTDPTGNRRWLPFEVENIDNPMRHPVPYEGLYAQAYALWKSGFTYWFSREEIQELNRHNEHFEVPNLEGEQILRYFRKPAEGENGVLVTTAYILERISGILRQPMSAVKVGIIMKKSGFKKAKHNNLTGYIVVENNWEDMDRDRKSGALGI
ncbi:BT4734/BF3469 family protein [uncultured Parabacteroides sp.]|uniref:BT4734/BF3469 family protein n=1 Tax=uncultured Parabacteroides sp. TaxID=512312 RepID=UPI0025D19139|nr:BT4734/BF3469 family protein [uncultured Parabacteroides sp.]